MELVVKHFSELSTEELFEIYKLRVAKNNLHTDKITIAAQVYAHSLYEKCGKPDGDRTIATWNLPRSRKRAMLFIN